jgi:hypothetical protein
MLIRLGGLAAMVGGVIYATLGWVIFLRAPNLPESIGFIQSALFILLLLGAMAAIAALHALQRQRHGWARTTVASLIAFIGAVLILVGGLGELLASSPADRTTEWYYMTGNFLLVGLLVATVGIIALGIFTLEAGVLPWWCGVALIAGSPFIGFFLYLFELEGLVGAPWVVVGFAVFRAAGQRTERPPRVR